LKHLMMTKSGILSTKVRVKILEIRKILPKVLT
jgi:hypothetical protein